MAITIEAQTNERTITSNGQTIDTRRQHHYIKTLAHAAQDCVYDYTWV